MIKILLTCVFLICILFVAGDYQYIRYSQFVNFCKHERLSDLLLIKGACRDTRLNSIRSECEKVKHRLRLEPAQCARSKMINKSELMRLWLILTNSYFGVLGFVLTLILPVMLYSISKCVTGWFDEKKAKRYLDEQVKFVEKFYLEPLNPNATLGQQTNQQSRSMLEYSPTRTIGEKRRKRKHVYTLSDSDDDNNDGDGYSDTSYNLLRWHETKKRIFAKERVYALRYKKKRKNKWNNMKCLHHLKETLWIIFGTCPERLNRILLE